MKNKISKIIKEFTTLHNVEESSITKGELNIKFIEWFLTKYDLQIENGITIQEPLNHDLAKLFAFSEERYITRSSYLNIQGFIRWYNEEFFSNRKNIESKNLKIKKK